VYPLSNPWLRHCPPDLLAGFKGPTSKGRVGRGEKKERERRERGRKYRIPPSTFE